MNIVSFRQKRGGECAYLFFFLFFWPPLASFLSTPPPSISSSLVALLFIPFDPVFAVVTRFAGAGAFFWLPLRVVLCCDRVLGISKGCCGGVGGGWKWWLEVVVVVRCRWMSWVDVVDGCRGRGIRLFGLFAWRGLCRALTVLIFPMCSTD